MYRAVALAFLRQDRKPTGAEAAIVMPSLNLEVRCENGDFRLLLSEEDVTDVLRAPGIALMASNVSQLASVRRALAARQRHVGRLYRDDPGIVLEGRDIGTVVFPNADVKIYMHADPEVRATRRHAEYLKRGGNIPLETVLGEILARDRQDIERTLSPLRSAKDAIILDTTDLSLERQVQYIVDCVGNAVHDR